MTLHQNLIRLPALVGLLTCLAIPAIHAEDSIEFAREIRPILSDACFRCHGVDASKRKAKLRLDQEEGWLVDRDGHPAIVPGELDKSELYRRITHGDPEERMPPADEVRQLSGAEVATIRKWIEQGAKWQPHWSFVQPRRAVSPGVSNAAWPIHDMDRFVLSRLDKEGLSPAAPVDRARLLRRVTLDLTGLPPTLEELDAYLADQSPNAYDKVVDRLLDSSRYGEHMAVEWLDLARYADTDGYQDDEPRTMWRWREWLIDVLNDNLPFDQFTIEQLA
ncbi:MAG: DUF1549 domain-containing protein, partial [Nitrospirota bacterium]|nr:DUF1549 domain-containing protein [Nitrospirota bacterium]